MKCQEDEKKHNKRRGWLKVVSFDKFESKFVFFSCEVRATV